MEGGLALKHFVVNLFLRIGERSHDSNYPNWGYICSPCHIVGGKFFTFDEAEVNIATRQI